MELTGIMELQDSFDREHSGHFDWSAPVTEDNLGVLALLVLGIFGEAGELANIVQRVMRGDHSLDAARHEIEEEVADIFIYVVKTCNQMDMDLEEAYLSKLARNRARFKRYER